MSENTDPYRSINCGFHDYLEHFATLREPITFIYFQNDKQITLKDVVIFDLSGGRAGEFAHIKTATTELKIRMDKIISIGKIEAKTFNSDYC